MAMAKKAASDAREALTLIRVLQTEMVALRDFLKALEAIAVREDGCQK